MKLLSRVVWSEGMYLAPHHFQAQARYFEDLIQFATSSLWFKPYGLIECRFDGDALRNGSLALVHARGVFPDGLPFDVPQPDALPPPREIAESFPPTADTLTVFLAVPKQQIDDYLMSLGEQGASVRAMLQDDAGLRKMAKIPLMLNILTVTGMTS